MRLKEYVWNLTDYKNWRENEGRTNCCRIYSVYLFRRGFKQELSVQLCTYSHLEVTRAAFTIKHPSKNIVDIYLYPIR